MEPAAGPVTAPVAATPEPATASPAAGLDVSAVNAEARAAYEAGDFVGCAGLYASIVGAGEGDAIPYNAACCYALAGDPDRAFAMLEVIATRGYRDHAYAQADTDLASLHDDERWRTAMLRFKANEAAYLATLNHELYRLFEADQADRQKPPEQIDWKRVSKRDRERRDRLRAIVDAGEAQGADDYYHAAMVFQHGDGVADIEQAHAWAKKAVELDPGHRRARWLAAAAEDRVLMRSGKPQKYGTQYVKKDGLWILYDFDPATTDEERARWGVPPLAKAKARARAMNARP